MSMLSVEWGMGRKQKQCFSFCVQYIASAVLIKRKRIVKLERGAALIVKNYFARPLLLNPRKSMDQN